MLKMENLMLGIFYYNFKNFYKNSKCEKDSEVLADSLLPISLPFWVEKHLQLPQKAEAT